MPVLNIRTNVIMEEKHRFLKAASSRIATALGKPESYVMVMVADNQEMLFAGNSEPLAYVELKSLGLTTAQTATLSENICEFLSTELEINPSRIYIEFASPEREMFGWNGGTF
ncbi:MAG: phenylpyruvate tautomerase MIF-related protein [Mariprofundaceae bacterium]|nr:phenylpyruvate tautomerase MIF-related protein [Mariprofundaceae bacterium]